MTPRPRLAAAIGCILMLLGGFFASASHARDSAVIGTQLEPPVLDPTSNPAAVISEMLQDNVYEGLVRVDAAGEAVPSLAEAWEIADAGLTYVFHLRSGVRFHDGTMFDAAIAKFSLDRARDSQSLNPQKSRLAAISGIEAPDARTLVLRLSRRSGSLLQSLAWTAFAMVTPASAADNAAHPNGTGPFKFATWRRGDSITLIRNDEYWGERAGLQRVVFKFISEPAAAYAALMAGDVQAFPNYPAPESVAQFKADARFNVFVGSTEGETILALNNRKPPLNDVNVRRAIAFALDRAAIIDGAMFGYGEPIGSHFPPRNPAALDLTGRYPHSVEAARRLLTQAGYAKGFAVTLKLPPPSYARRGGEIIAAQLAAVGIRAQVENIEWAQWLDQVFARHDFDMTVIQHAEPMDFDIYGRDDYYFGYSSAEFKSLLAQLQDSIDPAQRKKTLTDIQRQLSEDSVNAFLFQYPKLSVYDRHLVGLGLDNPLNVTELGHAHFDSTATAVTASATGSHAGRWLRWPVLLLALGVLAWAARAMGPAAFGRRLLILIATLLLSSAVIFAIVQVAPGDPARFMLGLQADEQSVAAVRHELGLDGSALHRYTEWMGGLAHGDFGSSYTYRVPVGGLIAERLEVSLPLALYALMLTVLIAFPAGIIGAAYRGRAPDSVVSTATQLGIAIPNFWLGILLIVVFAISLRWVSAGGFPGWDAGVAEAIKALTLPAIALALPQAAILARVLRAALIETLQEDFVRTARAKGLTHGAALRRHALPNALLPVLTVLGLQFSFLLAGGIIIENVFFLPGLGRLVFQAIVQRDLMVVQSVVLLLVFAVVVISFLVDLAYVWIDPRLRRTSRA